MPSYEITSPDGKKWVVDAPEGATQEQVLSYAQQQWSAAPKQEPKRMVSQELGRQGGLTLRAAAQGVMSFPGMVNDAIGGVYNTGADLIQGKGKGFRFQPTAYAVGNLLDKAGVAKPENADERVVQEAATLGFGAMSGAGLAGGLSRSATNPVVNKTLAEVAARPGMQVASAVGAGGAGAISRENGGSPGQQFLASLFGGLSAPLAVKGLQSLGDTAGRIINQARNPEQLTATLRMELERAGIKWDDLSAPVKVQLQNDAKKAVYSGQSLDGAALRRLADFRTVGATPLLGDITQDPVMLTRQRNLSKTLANMGEDSEDSLPMLENKNTAQVLDSINRLGRSPDDAFTTGQRIIDRVKSQDAGLKAQESALYGAAREAYGRDIPLDRGAFLQSANQRLDDTNAGYALPPIVRNILNEFSDNPNQPFTVDRIDSLKRILSNEAFKAQRSGDGNAGMAIRAVREALDDVQPRIPAFGGNQLATPQQAATLRQGDPAAEAMRLFDTARGFARDRRQWQESAAFIEDALGGAAPDDFVKKHIIGADVGDLAKLKQMIGAGGASESRALSTVTNPGAAPSTATQNQQLIESVRQQLLNYVKQRGGVEDGLTKMGSKGMKDAFDSIGERKWSMFFDNQELQQIKAAINVGRLMQVQTAGSATNNSNTAGAAIGQLLNIRNIPVLGDSLKRGAASFQLGRMQNLTPGLLSSGPKPLVPAPQPGSVESLLRAGLPPPLALGLLAAPVTQPGQN